MGLLSTAPPFLLSFQDLNANGGLKPVVTFGFRNLVRPPVLGLSLPHSFSGFFVPTWTRGWGGLFPPAPSLKGRERRGAQVNTLSDIRERRRQRSRAPSPRDVSVFLFRAGERARPHLSCRGSSGGPSPSPREPRGVCAREGSVSRLLLSRSGGGGSF